VSVQYSYTSTPPEGRTACTEPQCLYSTAIPLLPLWAVRPLQTLSACTVELYLYSPLGPYGLYRASVSVQYSYTSTPSMGRTACTDPQCLYSRAIPLLPPEGRTACTEPQCLYSRAIPLLPLRAVRPVQSLSVCTRMHFTFTFTHLEIQPKSINCCGLLTLHVLSMRYFRRQFIPYCLKPTG